MHLLDTVKATYPLKGHYFHIEPDDGTRYEFIVAPDATEDGMHSNNIFIASVLPEVPFAGYRYLVGSILEYQYVHFPDQFFIPQNNHVVYRPHSGSVLNPYIEYMMEHSRCSPWTAVAAIMAGVLYVETIRHG